jgi:3-methylfumaryl-CoA hydratase
LITEKSFMPGDIEKLRSWIGKSESRSDIVTPAPVAGLSATLDRDDSSPQPGDALPPLWHWLYFLPHPRQSEVGAGGHPERGGFLPPVPLPRRMWAGGRLTFARPLRIGENITRVSTVADVSHKQGRTGELVFVLARHAISDSTGLALSEEHDIVYREMQKPGDATPQPQAAPEDHAWIREIHADPVMLFRYSALTFNGHRIHYDRKYVTEVEGYAGLVVHGPLIATLLMDLLRRNLPEATVAQFSFRAVKPLFDLAPFFVCGRQEGKTMRLWAKDVDGWLAMEATAELI